MTSKYIPLKIGTYQVCVHVCGVFSCDVCKNIIVCACTYVLVYGFLRVHNCMDNVSFLIVRVTIAVSC